MFFSKVLSGKSKEKIPQLEVTSYQELFDRIPRKLPEGLKQNLVQYGFWTTPATWLCIV